MRNVKPVILVDFDDTLVIKSFDEPQIRNPFINSSKVESTSSVGDISYEYYLLHQASIASLHLLQESGSTVWPMSQRIDYTGQDEFRKIHMYAMLNDINPNRNYFLQKDGDDISKIANEHPEWKQTIEIKTGLLQAAMSKKQGPFILIDDGDKYLQEAGKLGISTVNSIELPTRFVKTGTEIQKQGPKRTNKIPDDEERAHLSSLLFTSVFIREYLRDNDKNCDDIMMFIDQNTQPNSLNGLNSSQNLSSKLNILECLATFNSDTLNCDPERLNKLQKQAADYIKNQNFLSIFNPQRQSFFQRKTHLNNIRKEEKPFVEEKRKELRDLLSHRAKIYEIEKRESQLNELSNIMKRHNPADPKTMEKLPGYFNTVHSICTSLLKNGELTAFDANLDALREYMIKQGIITKASEDSPGPSRLIIS